MKKRGLLLLNLGTPDAPTTPAVRRYLREFLSDPRVIDIPAVFRWLLVHAAILPVRPKKSAAAYQKVWMKEGSPLMVYSRELQAQVASLLQGEFEVALGMRYGEPSIASALQGLRAQGVEEITVFPLYPQYASSSTGTALEEVYRLLGSAPNALPVKVVPAFYDQPGFLDAFAQVAAGSLQKAPADHVLFSFHGLPERQVRKSDETGKHCFSSASCCDQMVSANRHCYRAQCFATARALAERLELCSDQYSVSFQSRLGRTPWIKPFTDVVIPELAKKHPRLAVICPSFVADCLETLEEVAIRAREQFVEAGGKELTLVPSLNAHPAWVKAVVETARKT